MKYSDIINNIKIISNTNSTDYTPTSDNDLTTKKFVDKELIKKVDKIDGKSLVQNSEIARLAKLNNYDDTEVRNLITTKADTSTIPTKVSQLTNDSGYLTTVPDTYATQSYVIDAINKAQLDGSQSEIDLNAYALKSDVELKAYRTELHDHTNKSLLDNLTIEDFKAVQELTESLNGPKNLYNPDTVNVGTYLNSSGGLYDNTAYNTTDYIPIVPGQTLYFYASRDIEIQVGARFVAFYDSERKHISELYINDGMSSTYSATASQENVAYIRATFMVNNEKLGYIENVNPGVELKYGEQLSSSNIWGKPNKIDVFLPDDIYCAVGRTIEIYNNQVCLQADKLHINWVCDYGHAMKRKFSITGTSALAGNSIPLTLEIYDDYMELLFTQTTDIHIVSNVLSENKTCVPIGDSWTNQKPWMPEVINLSNDKISFVGKFAYTGNDADGNSRTCGHEGRSGFSAYGYDTASSYTFAGADETQYHAFWNPTTSRFDWNYYVENILGGIQPDTVILQMGINGIVFNNTSMVSHEVNIINHIRQDNADIPIFICIPAYKGNQDGLGVQTSNDGFASNKGCYDYGERQKVMDYVTKLYKSCKDMVGVYFIPQTICFDSEYNYGSVDYPVNPRATITEKLPVEAVHPQDYGYFQMADIVYSTICANI